MTSLLIPAVLTAVLVIALVMLGVEIWKRVFRGASDDAQLPTDLQSHRARQAEVERLREHALRHHFNREEIAKRTQRARRYGI